jgi:hypothetical protein
VIAGAALRSPGGAGTAGNLAQKVGRPRFRTMLRVTDETLHSALSHVFDIGIACECGRRALLPVTRCGATAGSTIKIRDLRLVYAGCGARKFEAFLFFSQAQPEAFARGDSYADVWDLRNDGLPSNDPRVVYWSHLKNPFREPPPPPAGASRCQMPDGELPHRS